MYSVFFTIIVPIYNVAQYLEKCIKSILQQEKADFEVILVNDGSTDGSEKICMAFSLDPRVIVLQKENGGLSDARNYAHRYINGKYVLYLDADDYIESKTFLYESKKILQDMSDIDMLIFGYKKYFEEKDIFKVYLPNIKEKVVVCNFSDAIEKGYYILSAWGKVIKADYIKKGLEFEKGVLCEDMLWCVELALKVKKIVIRKDASYIYCQRNNSISKITTEKKIVDIENNIINSISLVQKYNKNRIKKEQIYCFIAQYYSMYIICLSLMPKKEQKTHYVFMEKYKELLRYGNRKREKILWLMFKIFGSITSLRIIRKVKNNLDKRK